MDRQKLIDLSYHFGGEYSKIAEAIKNNRLDVPKAPNLKCITIFDVNYPKTLLSLNFPPLVLYYKGDISLLDSKDKVAVVGCRMPCEYTKEATVELCNRILTDKVIVSGLAKGVDGIAHDNANKTIAVLGCGIDYIYPYENKHIYEKIAEKGLILSEYPEKTVPYAHHFTFRNRIVAALSDDMYVMELNRKSGTLSSVNEALELGKNIHVLPMPYTSKTYNNYLIDQGARVILFDDDD